MEKIIKRTSLVKYMYKGTEEMEDWARTNRSRGNGLPIRFKLHWRKGKNSAADFERQTPTDTSMAARRMVEKWRAGVELDQPSSGDGKMLADESSQT